MKRSASTIESLKKYKMRIFFANGRREMTSFVNTLHTKTILIATQNEKKRAEIKEILKDVPGILLKGPDDFPFLPQVEEDGTTFQENAIKKAIPLAKACNTWAMSDDSGLEIDALGGRPGIYSCRYAGAHATDEKNIEKVLSELRGVPRQRRSARFVCAIALAGPHGLFFVVEGRCEGFITEEPRGKYGFGYDPIFYVPDHRQTFAELNPLIKNRLSHRAHALMQFTEKLQPLIRKL